MKSVGLIVAFAVVLAAPALAENAVDHAVHQPTATMAPAADLSRTTPAPTSDQKKPNGMMTCPMTKDGKTTVTSNRMKMPNAMAGRTMEKAQMTRCPMMHPSSGTTAAPPSAIPNGDAHRRRPFFERRREPGSEN